MLCFKWGTGKIPYDQNEDDSTCGSYSSLLYLLPYNALIKVNYYLP